MEQPQRESKFEVGERFVIPDLRALAPSGGRVELASQSWRSVYFDTDRHDLLHWGVTLQRRSGDADAGWQLEVPAGEANTEIRVAPTPDDQLPAELADLVAGLRRGHQLRPVVTIQTSRHVQRLVDTTGQTALEVADNHVSTSAPGAGAAVLNQWREIDTELGPVGDERLLVTARRRFIKAGARASRSPSQVARALGATPAPAAGRRRKQRRTAASVVLAYLREQDTALLAGDLSLRRGLGGIHPTRVATRRVRSTLRTFAGLFDPVQARAFDVELAWFAALLGQVRDREVLRDKCGKAVGELPGELVLGPVAAHLDQHLLSEQLQHQTALGQAMNSERYFALLAESSRWVTAPPLTKKAERRPDTLLRAVRRAERKLDRHLAAGLGPRGNDEALHKARKAAKRSRYAAELTAPVVGHKRARQQISRRQHLQDVLGQHQDAVVAADLLRRLGAAAGVEAGENGFTYGLLYAQQRRRAKVSRRQATRWYQHAH